MPSAPRPPSRPTWTSLTTVALALAVVAVLLLVNVAAAGPVPAYAPSHASPAARAADTPSASSDVRSLVLGGPIRGTHLVATVGVYNTPTTASWDSGHGYLYVTNFGSVTLGGNTVSILDQTNHTVLATKPVGDDPLTSVYDPADGYDYVLNFGITHNLTVFNGTSNVGSVSVGGSPSSGVFDTANGDLYITDYGSGNVSVVNGLSVVGSPATGAYPEFPAYDPNNHYVYVPCTGSDNVSILNGTSVIANVSVGGSPFSSVFDPANGWVYVINSLTNNVTIINGTTIQANVGAGGSPQFGAYDPLDGDVYFTDQGTNTVYVLNGTTPVANISVGSYPRNIVFDAATGDMVVPEWTSNAVTMINGTTVVATVSVGVTPYSATYDPGTEETYVVNFGTSNVSVLGNPASPENLTFHQTGLPNAVNWTARLNGTTYLSAGPNLTAVVPNGTYSYTVASTSFLYDPVNATGSVTVSGSTMVNVTFVPAYAITFDESGLASGTYWNVSIGTEFNGTLNTSAQLWEPNGSYTFRITPVAGYTTNWSGSVGVNGAPATVLVTFHRLTYAVDFTETGLIGGTPWSALVGPYQNNSTGGSLVIDVPNGTYTYTIPSVSGYSASLSSGPVTVNGTAVHVAVTFTAIYTVTFQETGLPSGGNWSVHIGSTNKSSNTPTITFGLKNGSYAFTIATLVGGYTANLTHGNVHVNGRSVSKFVTFSLPANNSTTYSVTFRAVGLQSGAVWTVSVGGITQSTANLSLAFPLVNGSYAFAANASGYNVTPSSGPITVHGASSVATPTLLTFTLLPPPTGPYAITFEELQLPSGTHWGLSLGGVVLTSTSSTIVYHEANGTLPIAVSPLAGYQLLNGVANATTWSGTVTIAGAPEMFKLTFDRFLYEVDFQESGLPAGDSWSVVLDLSSAGPAVVNETLPRNPNVSTHALLVLWAPNGTFPYTVPAVAGYSPPSGGTVTIQGSSPAPVSIAFAPNGGPKSSALTATDVVVIVAAGVLLSLVAAVFLTRRRGPTRPPTTRRAAPPAATESHETEGGLDASTGVYDPKR